MSVLALLRNTLKKTGWLVRQDVYYEMDGSKREEKYIVFNLAHEEASGYSDNIPLGERSYWQIHIFLPEMQNPAGIKKHVKSLLFHAGFSYPDTVLDTLEGKAASEGGKAGEEKSSRKRHICLETNITQEMED